MRPSQMLLQIAVAAAWGLAAQSARSADIAKLEDIPLPSGQTVTWVDTVHDAPGPDGLTIRFRFIAPAIARVGGTVSIEDAQDDMQVLCDRFALPRIASTGPTPSEIIISLSDRPVTFGQPDEGATQIFDAYAIADGTCEVQVF